MIQVLKLKWYVSESRIFNNTFREISFVTSDSSMNLSCITAGLPASDGLSKMCVLPPHQLHCKTCIMMLLLLLMHSLRVNWLCLPQSRLRLSPVRWNRIRWQGGKSENLKRKGQYLVSRGSTAGRKLWWGRVASFIHKSNRWRQRGSGSYGGGERSEREREREMG